jgi:hypothetical protein
VKRPKRKASGKEGRPKLVKELIDNLTENQANAAQVDRERFVRSLGAKPSKFIDGPIVPLPELNPDGTLKKK